MSELNSTIRIEDGFTEPLKDLAKEAYKAGGFVKTLGESVAELNEHIEREELENYAWLASMKPTNDALKALSKTYKQVSSTIKFESLVIRSKLENRAEVFMRTAKTEMDIMKTSIIAHKNQAQEYAKQVAARIKFETSGINTFLALSKHYGMQRASQIAEQVKHRIKLEANGLSTTATIMKKYGLIFLKDNWKSISGRIANEAKGFQTFLFLSKRYGKDMLKEAAKQMSDRIKFQTSGFKTFYALSKHYGKQAVNDVAHNVAERVGLESEGFKKIPEFFNKYYTPIKSFFKSEIAGYQDYKKHLLELKRMPIALNTYDKIGLAGHRLGRWADQHGMKSLARHIHTQSGNILNKYGAKPVRVEDPSAFKYTMERLKYYGKELARNTSEGLKKGFSWLKESAGGKIFTDFALDFGKMFGAAMIQNIAFSLFRKVKEKMATLLVSANNAIQNSLDELNLSDKYAARFGSKGDSARQKAYELANEIGESATMVGEMSAQAAFQGIGTKSFEKIMRLSDRISKSRVGATTEGVASDIISSIKSGRDAGTIASLLGGDHVLEGKLRKAGYEKALNKGDLAKALDIATQIAEQSGFSKDNYDKSSNSISQNYKKILNVVDNVKRRLGEIYTQSLSPAVEKLKNFVESKQFQVAVKGVEKAVKFIGEKVSLIIESFIDNIHIISAILAAGVVAKLYLGFRSLQATIAFIPLIKSGIIWIANLLGLKGIAGTLATITRQQLVLLIRTKAIAAVKMVGPWLAVAAALGAISYGIYKANGGTKSFSGYLKGALYAAYQIYGNIVSNIIIFMENRVPSRIKILFKYVEMHLIKFIQVAKSKVAELLSWIMENLEKVLDESGVSTMLKLAGININISGLAKMGKEYFDQFTTPDFTKVEEIKNQIDHIELMEMKYVDLMDGVKDAFETEGQSILNWLDKLFRQGEQQIQDGDNIEDHLGAIRSQGEREEELKWLKAFSDRQIMSSYNSTTSNSQTINLNGVSQNTMAEAYRRNRSTIPSRAST